MIKDYTFIIFSILLITLPGLISCKLGISTYPKLKSLELREIIYEEDVKTDVDGQYFLHKRVISGNQIIMTLYFRQSLLRFLTSPVEESRQHDPEMTMTSDTSPFMMFQFRIFQGMAFEKEFQTIVGQFRHEYTEGLSKVLSKFNSVKWNQEMLNYFYDNCGYQLYFTYPQSATNNVWGVIKLMIDNKYSLGQVNFSNFVGLPLANDINDRRDVILTAFRADVDEMMYFLYCEIQNDRFFDIDSNTHIKKLKSQMTDPNKKKFLNLLTFNEQYKQQMDSIVNELGQLLSQENLINNHYSDERELRKKYSFHMSPILDNDVFLIFNIILLNLRKNYVVDYGKEYVKSLYELYEEVTFIGLETLRKEFFYKMLANNYFYDKMDSFDDKNKNNAPEFTSAMKNCLTNLFTFINQSLPQIEGGNAEKVKKVKKFFMRQLSKKYYLKRPIMILMFATLHNEAFELVSGFKDTQVYTQLLKRTQGTGYIEKILELLRYFGVVAGTKMDNIVSVKLRLFEIMSNNKFIISNIAIITEHLQNLMHINNSIIDKFIHFILITIRI